MLNRLTALHLLIWLCASIQPLPQSRRWRPADFGSLRFKLDAVWDNKNILMTYSIMHCDSLLKPKHSEHWIYSHLKYFFAVLVIDAQNIRVGWLLGSKHAWTRLNLCGLLSLELLILVHSVEMLSQIWISIVLSAS